MPWSEPPAAVKERYNARCAAVWVTVANAELAKSGDEGRAIRIANTAANNCAASGKASMSETKALIPVKAQLLEDDELDAWLEGRKPRRLLVIPFGGPIPSEKSSLGVDLDGQFFDERTDIFGGFRALRESRDRLVDWHHSIIPPLGRTEGPKGGLTGRIIGKAVIDTEPDEDGWWADFWIKAGEKRVSLIRTLAQRGAQLFGSSQIIPGSGKANAETGHIERWPFFLETLTTSPKNTLSVLRPAKAMLDEADLADIHVTAPFRELLTDLDNLGADLPLTSYLDGDSGDVAAKAGRVLSARNERSLREALTVLQRYIDLMAGNAQPDPPTEGDASST